MYFGPFPPGASEARGEVVFDARTCVVQVAHTDLDAGPENRDLRLRRVWTGSAWAWADDWSVVNGIVRRPGQADIAVDALRATLEVDPLGNVIARTVGVRRVEILREGGNFTGMQVGKTAIHVTGEDGRTSDDRSVRYSYTEGQLSAFTAEDGVRTLYEYAAGRLSTVIWADGGVMRVDAGVLNVPGGAWRCIESGDRTDILAPGSLGWSVRWRDDGAAVIDPSGAVTQSLTEGGRLAGWRDARSGAARIGRNGRGNVTELSDGSGGSWAVEWDDARMTALRSADGARWGIAYNDRGQIARVTDPVGRPVDYAFDDEGRLLSRRQSGGLLALARDAVGRIVTLRLPGFGEVRVARDANGRVSGVTDAAGGVWVVSRDPMGRISGVGDPDGARWELRRDRLGGVSSVRDPVGRAVSWLRRDDGRATRVSVGSGDWQLLRDSKGMLTGLRDPMGRLTGWSRDPLGRVTAVQRADRSMVRIDRDPAGDVRAVAEAIVRRDWVGRPLGVDTGAGVISWDRDLVGRVVGVSSLGLDLALERAGDGQVRGVRVRDADRVELRRDDAGRVVTAAGGATVQLDRDAGGRITTYRRNEHVMRIQRDPRGLVARLTVGDSVWAIGRDAAGRIMRVEAPDDVSLGVARDLAGRPALVRFADAAFARISRGEGAVDVIVEDTHGVAQGRAGWTEDASGRVDGVVTDAVWSLRRDPLGTLVTAESPAGFWSVGPDGMEGPYGATLAWDTRGRPLRGVAPTEGPPLWGVASGPVAYVTDQDGVIMEIAGSAGSARLRHDGVGRLTGWTAPDGDHAVVRDAFGRLAGVAGVAVEGWDVLLSVADSVRAVVTGAGVGRPGGGLLVDPRGTPLLALHGGAVRSSPSGLPFDAVGGEAGAAGRFQPMFGGPLLGLTDAIDPFSGQTTGGRLSWPWSGRRWEALPEGSPWADPDSSSDVWWDDAPWRSEAPWASPLDLLIARGELPDGGPRMDRSPGLPWLPASFGAAPPSPIRDAFFLDEEPIVAWVIGHAVAGTAASPPELASLLIGREIAAEIVTPPELLPELPPELR